MSPVNKGRAKPQPTAIHPRLITPSRWRIILTSLSRTQSSWHSEASQHSQPVTRRASNRAGFSFYLETKVNSRPHLDIADHQAMRNPGSPRRTVLHGKRSKPRSKLPYRHGTGRTDATPCRALVLQLRQLAGRYPARPAVYPVPESGSEPCPYGGRWPSQAIEVAGVPDLNRQVKPVAGHGPLTGSPRAVRGPSGKGP